MQELTKEIPAILVKPQVRGNDFERQSADKGSAEHDFSWHRKGR